MAIIIAIMIFYDDNNNWDDDISINDNHNKDLE